MKKIILTTFALILASSAFAQDSVEEKINYQFGPFKLSLYVSGDFAGRVNLYFRNEKYKRLIDLGSIWYTRKELDVLHTKIVECLDYSMNKEKTATAKWNLPDGAYIESDKQYNWNWLSADGKYATIEVGKAIRDQIDKGFNAWKAMIDK